MTHEDYMRLALLEAEKARKAGEVPVGAVIVKDGLVIAKTHNLREVKNSALAHAEILAINKANEVLNSWRLDSCSMYVTIEPCPMCAGAIIQSRIKEVFYGAKDYKSGSHESIVDLFDKPFNHKVHVTSGILEKECAEIMSGFFRELRKK